jgi:hypothetical protein
VRGITDEGISIHMSMWLKRIGWLLLLWAASVAALALIAAALKLVMRAAGLTT